MEDIKIVHSCTLHSPDPNQKIKSLHSGLSGKKEECTY